VIAEEAWEHSFVESVEVFDPGEHQVHIEFNYNGVGKEADLTSYVDGEANRNGRFLFAGKVH